MFVESDGVRLAVRERGDRSAPTIVLVHGYPDTQRVWDGVADVLAEDFHVVTYDVRGAGESDKPRALGAYRLPVLARDLFAVVDAVSPVSPVHLVGHDWGSIQSWEAVTTPGARIASCTSISGLCLDHVGHWARRRPTAAHLEQLLRSWYVAVLHVPFVAPWVWRRVVGPRWGRLLRRSEGAQGHLADTVVEDGVHGMSLYRANFIPRLRSPRERRTDVPVLLVRLLRDRFVAAGALTEADRWTSDLRHRTLDAGHWAPVTHARALALLVAEHVTAHTTPDEPHPAPDPTNTDPTNTDRPR